MVSLVFCAGGESNFTRRMLVRTEQCGADFPIPRMTLQTQLQEFKVQVQAVRIGDISILRIARKTVSDMDSVRTQDCAGDEWREGHTVGSPGADGQKHFRSVALRALQMLAAQPGRAEWLREMGQLLLQLQKVAVDISAVSTSVKFSC